jgi:hypothetical protein
LRFVAVLPLIFGTVHAQDVSDTNVLNDDPMQESEEESTERQTGHKFKATAGANLLENKNVVGQDDGKTTIYTLDLNYDYLRLGSLTEWDFNVSVEEAFSKTPAIDRMIKTTDSLKLLSTYKRFFAGMEWLGAFGRVELKAPLMDGYNEQAGDVTYLIARDEKVETVVDERLKLNDGFKPLTTKESLGLLAKAYDSKKATVEFRSGIGAKQISGSGQLLVKDDEETAEIEVVELENVTMVGFAAGLEAKGSVSGLDYKLMAEALYPMSYSPKDDSDPDASELVSTEVSLDLSYSFNSWMSANYKITSTKDPLLTDKAQVAQNFMLAVTYVLDSNE